MKLKLILLLTIVVSSRKPDFYQKHLRRALSDLEQVEKTTTGSIHAKGYVDDGGLAGSIDPSQDPCDDFYEFVCAGWKRKNPIDEFHAVRSHPNDLETTVLLNYHQMIMEMLSDQRRMSNMRREQLLWLQYIFTCANVEPASHQGNLAFFETKRKLKAAKFGNLTDWLIRNHPHTTFFNTGVAADVQDATRNVIMLAPLEPIQDHASYTNPLYKQQYDAVFKYLTSLFTILANDDINNEFFANNSTDVQRKVSNILKVDRGIAQIDYEKYFKATVPLLNQLDSDKVLIRVRNLGAIQEVDRFLKTLTPQEIDDFGDFSVLQDLIPFLDNRIKDIQEQYKFEALGTRSLNDSLGQCLQLGIKKFPEIATTLYIQRYYSESTTREVATMVENIRQSFVDLLMESQWMDPRTKEAARKKANLIKLFFGYNKKIFNETAVAEKYADLVYPEPLTYYGIQSAYNKWMARRVFEKILVRNSRDDFEFLATNPNAFYMASVNGIAISVGILQSPYFNVGHSKAQNYGALGSIIGHEITHGFDDYGAKFDGHGNKRNWWLAKTMRSFQNSAKCFVDQYSATQVDHLNLMVNGARTLSENIADNGGIRAAYDAFQKLASKTQLGNRPSSPKLQKYSPNQLFFMGFAYQWCQSVSPEFLIANVPLDIHSPNRQRVNLMLRNSPDFQKSFQCSPKSKMIHGNKCQLW